MDASIDMDHQIFATLNVNNLHVIVHKQCRRENLFNLRGDIKDQTADSDQLLNVDDQRTSSECEQVGNL